MSKVMINSPFVRPVDREVFEGTPAGETEYIDRKVYLQYVETGIDENGKSIGSIQPVVKETKKDIDKLINSHANEVGLKNLIALYLRTGDDSIFNQKTSLNSVAGSKGFVDVTELPGKSASEIFSDIPAALKGNKDMEEFLKTLTKDQFEKFITGLKAEVSNKEKVKEVTSDE